MLLSAQGEDFRECVTACPDEQTAYTEFAGVLCGTRKLLIRGSMLSRLPIKCTFLTAKRCALIIFLKVNFSFKGHINPNNVLLLSAAFRAVNRYNKLMVKFKNTH